MNFFLRKDFSLFLCAIGKFIPRTSCLYSLDWSAVVAGTCKATVSNLEIKIKEMLLKIKEL